MPAPHVVSRRFDPPLSRWGAGHRGVDLSVAEGSQISAPAAGTVSFAGMVAGRPVVVIAHSSGLRSTLEPVQALLPVGASVAAGDEVGRVAAATGHCLGSPCLHWGVLRGQTYLDPLAWLQGRVVLLPVTAFGGQLSRTGWPGPGRAAVETLGLLHHDGRGRARSGALGVPMAETMPDFVVDQVGAVRLQVLAIGCRATQPSLQIEHSA